METLILKTFQVTFSICVDRSHWLTVCRDVTASNGHQAVVIGRKELRKHGAYDDSGYFIHGRRIGELKTIDMMRIDDRPEYQDPNRIPDPSAEVPPILSLSEYRRQQLDAREVRSSGKRGTYQFPFDGDIS